MEPVEGEKNRCAGITENEVLFYERKQRKKLHASFPIGDKKTYKFMLLSRIRKEDETVKVCDR